MDTIRAIIDRIANEPALVIGVIGAVGLLIGKDLSEWSSLIESVLMLLGAVVVRQQVTPVRSLYSDD